MADFRPFNLGEALGAGQNLAVNQYRLGEMENQVQGRQALRQAVSTGTPEAMDAFKKQYPEKAREWESQSVQFKKQALDYKMSQLDMLGRLASGVSDQASYERAIGLAKELELDIGEAPPQYDPNFIKQAQNQILTAKDRVSMAKDVFDRQYKTETLKETKRHHKRTEEISAAKAAKESGIKPSEFNAVRARIADLFGGVYDPITGRIGGLDKEQTKRALSIQERAEAIYRRTPVSERDPASAAAQAAREAGIPIDKIGAPKPAPTPEPTGQPSQADLEYTAKKHGITVEEVKKRLGIE